MKVSQEIEVMENQRKKKGNALFPREEEIIIKVRITNRKEEEKKKMQRGDDRTRTLLGSNPCIQ